MALSRDGLLAGMSNLNPSQNQQVAQGLGAQNTFAQKQQAGQAYMGGQSLGKPQVAQMGAQLAGQKAGANLNAAQSTVQQQQQIGQVGLQQQQQQAQAQLGEKRIGLQKKQRELDNGLAKLGEEAKNKLFTANLAFQKDEMGYTAFNERQLLDWQVTKAKSVQDLYNYQQQVQQVSQRKLQYLKAAQQKVVQEINNNAKDKMMSQDQATQEKLLRAKLGLETQLQEEQRKAQNRAAMISSGIKMAGFAPLIVPIATAAYVAKAVGLGNNPVNNTLNQVTGGNVF